MPLLISYLVIQYHTYIEDITRWREDMNFMFEWQEQYLTSERSERVRYCSCYENIKFTSSNQRVMFFLLYKQGVFDDFSKTSDHFPKISENFPKLFRRPDERSRIFSKMSEDCRRLTRKTRRCFDDTPTNLSTVWSRLRAVSFPFFSSPRAWESVERRSRETRETRAAAREEEREIAQTHDLLKFAIAQLDLRTQHEVPFINKSKAT